jgi:hypothetical protein
MTAASPNTAPYGVVEAGARLFARDYPFGGTISKQFLKQVKCHTHRASAGVGAKVATSVIIKAPCQEYAGPFFIKGNFDIRIAFIIPQSDIVARSMLLNKVIFEDKGFLLGICDDEIEALYHGHHLVQLRVVGMRSAEIRPNAVAQAGRFSYIEHLPRLILEQINAGLCRQRLKLFLQPALFQWK